MLKGSPNETRGVIGRYTNNNGFTSIKIIIKKYK